MNSPLFIRITFILTVLVFAVCFTAPFWIEETTFWEVVLPEVFFLFWGYVLWNNGRLRVSKLRSLFFLFLALLPIASLIKIQHWANSGPIFAVAFAGMGIVYLLHFFQKTVKSGYETLKLVWFLSFVLLKILVALRLVQDGYQALHIPLFLIVLFFFIKQKPKQLNAHNL